MCSVYKVSLMYERLLFMATRPYQCRNFSINRAWGILKEANQLLAEPVQLPGSLDNPTKEVLEQLCDIQRGFTAAYAISLQQSTQAKLQEARQAAKQAAAESPDDNEAALNLLAAESKLAVLTAIGPADPKKPEVMKSLASKWLSAFPANRIFRLSKRGGAPHRPAHATFTEGLRWTGRVPVQQAPPNADTPCYHLRKGHWCPNYPQGSEDSIGPCDPTLPCQDESG